MSEKDINSIRNDFNKSDDMLKKKVSALIEERKTAGLEGLVGGLEAIIINVEEFNHESAVQDLLNTTGYDVAEYFANSELKTSVLTLENSADILVSNRKDEENPFRKYNIAPKTDELPNTRLETFVFHTDDIKRYVDIQKERGIKFLSDEVIDKDNYLFIQTTPSKYTGISVGLIQWKGKSRTYNSGEDQELKVSVEKPDWAYLKNIKYLDHTATRVRALERDDAILEFMSLTNYNFEFAIYVKSFNSITNVARLSAKDFAMVFTSGISPYKSEEESGPTEKFIHNYNTRTHHMAFHTENIDRVFSSLKKDGMEFLVELVGSPEEGLKQTFTESSPTTFLVNEYIHRFGDFDGFFTKNNVTLLTESTEKQ